MAKRIIRDYRTYLAAKVEIAALDDGSRDLSMENFRKLTAIRDEVECFETYLPLHLGHPSAASMLEYAINHIKPLTRETAAAELGITDLDEILAGRRLPTYQEAERLSRYFEIAPDSFTA